MPTRNRVARLGALVAAISADIVAHWLAKGLSSRCCSSDKLSNDPAMTKGATPISSKRKIPMASSLRPKARRTRHFSLIALLLRQHLAVLVRLELKGIDPARILILK